MTMKSISRKAGRFLSFIHDKSGVSAVEYALIVVAVIAIVGVGAATLGDAFGTLFTNLQTELAVAASETESAVRN